MRLTLPFFFLVFCLILVVSAAWATEMKTISVSKPATDKTAQMTDQTRDMAHIDGDLADTNTPSVWRSDAGLDKAAALLTRQKYTQSITTLQNVLKRNAANADAYAYLGYAYQKLGDDENALKNLERALKLNPRHLGANYYLGIARLEQGKLAQALEQLQVMRMVCGQTDCAEMRHLEHAINQADKGE